MTLDTHLLSALRETPTGISGTDLSGRLGISRAAVWARIEELRRLGYEIEATPHSGYRLVSAPDRLYADDLQARLGGARVVGRVIQVFEQTASTNDLVDRLGRDGSGEGVVVFAEAQTRGRGRLGRAWSSPVRAGLWFSILLRPELAPRAVTQVTVLGAVAIRRAIKKVTGVEVEIKWPNDLLIRGKKCGGILTELSAEPERVKYVVLGVGVNINQSLGDFPEELRSVATSLRLETGRAWDRGDLAVGAIGALDESYCRLRSGGFGALAEEWEAACTTLGRHVVIRIGDRRVGGRAEALDGDGALLVRTDHGHLEHVTGGDVTVQP
jgi:BirA family biotin operon repressor/biotin-[acetyl-CoA-carboxylase] ligase